VFNLLPRQTQFYDELESLSDHVVSASGQLKGLIAAFPDFSAPLRAIETDRRAAREIYEESLVRLDQTFITPLDREDILSLITEMYGVIDRISELSQRFRLYRIQEIYPNLTAQSGNLSAIAEALNYVVSGLRRQHKLTQLKPQIETVTRIMESVKRDREKFLSSLFEENADPLDVLKKKELHDLLEEAIERCEEATETMERVLLKNA